MMHPGRRCKEQEVIGQMLALTLLKKSGAFKTVKNGVAATNGIINGVIGPPVLTNSWL